MKLSTSGFARGRAGTIVAIIVMGVLLGITGGEIGFEWICVAGAATWLAVTLLLSANKDKEIF